MAKATQPGRVDESPMEKECAEVVALLQTQITKYRDSDPNHPEFNVWGGVADGHEWTILSIERVTQGESMVEEEVRELQGQLRFLDQVPHHLGLRIAISEAPAYLGRLRQYEWSEKQGFVPGSWMHR